MARMELNHRSRLAMSFQFCEVGSRLVLVFLNESRDVYKRSAQQEPGQP